ncbi:hypothetical protein C6Y02_13165 [Bacillus sp. NMCC4]|uniref:hypothetical protein n=1 Tax=Bacillus sp. NMCC4 TaxID=2108539 RepID=UPI000D0447FD|nr:hypothetical protein [Bacillus sp. NMCC4]PRS37411.1 hypothetical protein C6Y02_13165 [Bacillus sp. NMCC4]
MTIQYFRDSEGKKGSIGTKVIIIHAFWKSVEEKILTVDRIVSIGEGRTRLYFKERGFANPKLVKIIEK